MAGRAFDAQARRAAEAVAARFGKPATRTEGLKAIHAVVQLRLGHHAGDKAAWEAHCGTGTTARRRFYEWKPRIWASLPAPAPPQQAAPPSADGVMLDAENATAERAKRLHAEAQAAFRKRQKQAAEKEQAAEEERRAAEEEAKWQRLPLATVGSAGSDAWTATASREWERTWSALSDEERRTAERKGVPRDIWRSNKDVLFWFKVVTRPLRLPHVSRYTEWLLADLVPAPPKPGPLKPLPCWYLRDPVYTLRDSEFCVCSSCRFKYR